MSIAKAAGPSASPRRTALRWNLARNLAWRFGAAALLMGTAQVASAVDAAGSTLQATPSVEFASPILARPAFALARESNTRSASWQVVRTRWWWGSGIGLGAGTDSTLSDGAGTIRPVFGLHARLSPGTRLVYEVGPESAAPATQLPADTAPARRIALELKPARSVAQQLRSDLLRIQMSGSSTLLVRPRGGGVTVAWLSTF